LDDVGRTDAVGHRPGEVGITNTVVGAEGGIAQVFQATSRGVGRPCSWRQRGQSFGGNQRAAAAVFEKVDRSADGADRFRNDLCFSHGGTPTPCAQPRSRYWGIMIPLWALVCQHLPQTFLPIVV